MLPEGMQIKLPRQVQLLVEEYLEQNQAQEQENKQRDGQDDPDKVIDLDQVVDDDESIKYSGRDNKGDFLQAMD